MARVQGKTPKQARHGDTLQSQHLGGGCRRIRSKKLALSFIVELEVNLGYMRPFIKKNIAMQNYLTGRGVERLSGHRKGQCLSQGLSVYDSGETI